MRASCQNVLMADAAQFTREHLTGRTTSHVGTVPGFDLMLHRDVIAPFLALRAAAARDGLDVRPVSGFRDFARQCLIWNEKCRGLRPLRDRDERVIDPARLAPDALIDAVLLWSALPGASRHHWGTDVDVIDAAAVAPGYRVRLTVDEFAPGGPFERLDRWLRTHAAEFGFYRPYSVDRGGVQPEPWHLSHAATAVQAMNALTVDVLREALGEASLDLLPNLLARLPELHARFVCTVEPPPATAGLPSAVTSPSTPS
jgi:LAS superfamily LD-carboxypeptidase LdcB